ncbi:hypothetical protein cand_000730 [Cryptosporidium andersoni]|uniref:Uncharacterized protein n=1 Tax=Cryptosporidium andersoni TaxID=117008 RepID=A0A1J4MQT0_9CRYT|nr:hypothetical protein cand_000730 [Cryptosporidium andersoni]
MSNISNNDEKVEDIIAESHLNIEEDITDEYLVDNCKNNRISIDIKLADSIISRDMKSIAILIIKNCSLISGEAFWSLMFWNNGDLLALSLQKSTHLSTIVLTNSLKDMISESGSVTIYSIINILKQMNEWLELHIYLPKSLIRSNSSEIPPLKNILILYSIIVESIYPFFSSTLSIKTDYGGKLQVELSRGFELISRGAEVTKENKRTWSRFKIVEDSQDKFLNEVLGSIANKTSQIPVIQHMKLSLENI